MGGGPTSCLPGLPKRVRDNSWGGQKVACVEPRLRKSWRVVMCGFRSCCQYASACNSLLDLKWRDACAKLHWVHKTDIARPTATVEASYFSLDKTQLYVAAPLLERSGVIIHGDSKVPGRSAYRGESALKKAEEKNDPSAHKGCPAEVQHGTATAKTFFQLPAEFPLLVDPFVRFRVHGECSNTTLPQANFKSPEPPVNRLLTSFRVHAPSLLEGMTPWNPSPPHRKRAPMAFQCWLQVPAGVFFL